jgi:hypothetical protein
MTPNQSHVAGLELALSTAESMRNASELDAIDTMRAIEHGISLLIEQAKSAPAEVAQGEAVGEIGAMSGQTQYASLYTDFMNSQNLVGCKIYTAPPSPDAELVRQCIADELEEWTGDHRIAVTRAMADLSASIDAKLASL